MKKSLFMKSSDYKYDVAFSFTQSGEALAEKLYRLLMDRLNCFLYLNRQKELAGRDGEQLLNTVYAAEARIVVIIFTSDYGKTDWTRVEQTAVRNRGFDNGYDFLFLIPIEKGVSAPEWVPKNRLWFGLERWGVESAAATIEARVQEYGGNVRVETLPEKVARAQREVKEKAARENLLASEKGLGLQLQEVEIIKALLKENIEEIKRQVPDWQIWYNENRQKGLNVICPGYYLTFQYFQQYSNVIDGSNIYIGLYEGIYYGPGENVGFNQSQRIKDERLRFDINDLNQNGWSLEQTRKNFIISSKLVEKWFSDLISYAIKGPSPN
jgi:hypothetical protein